MPSSLVYTRKFIILKKEFSTMGGRNPKGHCKLEIKGLRGIVTVNIENGEADNFYNVLFISNDKSHLIWELGKIFTDDIGRGKGEYTFIQRELEAKNFPVDKISGILIMRDSEIFLGGYLDKEDGSLERYIKSMTLSSEPIPEPMPEPVLELISVPEPTERVELNELEQVIQEEVEVEEVEEEVETIETIETMEEPLNLELDHDPIYDTPAYDSIYDIPAREPIYDIPVTPPIAEEQEIEVKSYEPEVEEELLSEEKLVVNNEDFIQEETTPETTHEVKLDLDDYDEESMEPDYKTLDYIRKLNQKNQTTNYVLSILRFFPYIDPFKYNLKGYNWWLVELDIENEYRAFLPYFSYIIGGNNKEPYNNNIATCSQLMSKYGHYLFGLYNEGEVVKYFVYGVPGEFSTNEHPYRGANGFSTWYQGRNIEGYWVIYIDPMTGKPVYPVTPMIPVD